MMQRIGKGKREAPPEDVRPLQVLLRILGLGDRNQKKTKGAKTVLPAFKPLEMMDSVFFRSFFCRTANRELTHLSL